MPETLLYEVVEVTQADRDAAEQFFLKGGIGFRRLERAFARHRLAALASLQPSVSEMRWQPMESSPKDGSAVLILDGCRNVSIGNWGHVGRYTTSEQMWLGHPYGAMRDSDCLAWMPLPKPPALSPEGEP